MRKSSCVALAFFALVVSPSVSTHAAEFKNFIAKDKRVLISITGEIVEGDADRFTSAIKTANDAGRVVANIRLNSPGGNLGEGIKLANAVRYAKIASNVGKDGVCASACFLVFAAGNTKYANYTAQIGVHGASTPNGEDAGDATISMAKIAKDFGVPAEIIGRMVVTAPKDMVWLTPQELQSMGTTMVGKPNQIPAAATNLPSQTNRAAIAPNQVEQQAKASAPPSWKQVIMMAIENSAAQNRGKPITARSCQPEMKTCVDGVYYKDKTGVTTLVKVTKDIDDKIIRREVCTFNSSSDIRKCFNWDTGATHRDMKNVSGNWIQVADE